MFTREPTYIYCLFSSVKLDISRSTGLALIYKTGRVKWQIGQPIEVRLAKKLYAVRDKSGRFKDIQTYKRAHARTSSEKARTKNNRRLK